MVVRYILYWLINACFFKSASATGNEKTDFLKEIDLMKIISEGNSPHVVNMVGCVTAQEPLCLITEFIKHGDLLTYLRTNRKQVLNYLDMVACF